MDQSGGYPPPDHNGNAWKEDTMWHWNNNSADRQALGDYLANTLTATPDQSCQAWVELAEIHRKAGNKNEFDILAGRLKDICGIRLRDWTSEQ